MSHPYTPGADNGPEDNVDRKPEDRPAPAQYPAYPPTTHPEDRPGFTGERYEGYRGYDGDTSAGATTGTVGYAGADAGLPPEGELPQRPSDGTVRITDAIGWGFKATFRNWSLWIVLGIIGAGVLIVSSVVVGGMAGYDALQEAGETTAEFDSVGGRLSNYFSIVFGLISFFLAPLFYNAALWTLRRTKVGWSSLVDNVNYGPTLGMRLLVGVVSYVVLFLAAFIPSALLGIALSDLSSLETMDDSQVATLVSGILGTALFVLLLAIAIQPLIGLWAFVVADRQETFGKAIARGFKAGAHNWLRLIGLYVLLGLLCFVGLLFFTLGLIIALPVSINAMAYAYRQAIGESVPEV